MVQLAAVCGGHSLNLYVVPECRMQPGASRVTGFSVRRRQLYRHRRPLLTNSLREVLLSFLAFLRMLGRPLLLGHNIRHFDCRVLARALDRLELRAAFRASVAGCVDTLPLARQLLQPLGPRSFGQQSLVRELLGLEYKAHDALEDVRALQALYAALRPPPALVSRHLFTLSGVEPRRPAAAAQLPAQHLGHAATAKVTEVKTEELQGNTQSLTFKNE